MNKLLAILAVSFGASYANALPTSTPVYGCTLDAIVNDNGGAFLVRVVDATATGVINCIDWHGQTSSQHVQISLKGFGIGAVIAGPVTRLRAMTGKVGIASPASMFGTYHIEAGPGVTLFAERYGIDAGFEGAPNESLAANLSVTIEDTKGLGVDLTGYTMVIQPLNVNAHARHKHHKHH